MILNIPMGDDIAPGLILKYKQAMANPMMWLDSAGRLRFLKVFSRAVRGVRDMWKNKDKRRSLCFRAIYLLAVFLITSLMIMPVAEEERAEAAVVPRITKLIYPTFGFPQLSKTGSNFTLEFDFRQDNPSIPLPSDVDNWEVSISGSNDYTPFTADLPILSVDFGMSQRWPQGSGRSVYEVYKVTVEIPSEIPPDLYDLEVKVEADDLEVVDRQPHCLSVVNDWNPNYRIVQMTDIHVYDITYGNPLVEYSSLHDRALHDAKYLKKAISVVNFLNPDILVITGDSIFGQRYLPSQWPPNDGQPRGGSSEYEYEYSFLYEELQALKVPVFMVMGNHDGYYDTVDDGYDWWTKTFGPLFYSFDYGNHHYTAINTMDWPQEMRKLEQPWYSNLAGVLAPGAWQGQVRSGGDTNDFFEEYITIQNPNDAAVTIYVTYMMYNGHLYLKEHLAQPKSRYTINVNRDCPEKGEFSVRVDSSMPVICERPMYFDYDMSWNGGHCVLGSVNPSTTWYFAEGRTDSNFHEYLSLENPQTGSAEVNVTYMMSNGHVYTRSHIVPGKSRYSIMVNQDCPEGGDVSIKLDSTLPVIAERPMYFRYGGAWSGGHCVAGATHSATNWYFAEGYTAKDFVEYLTIQNPNDSDTPLTVNYMMANGHNYSKSHLVPAKSRYSISVNTDCPEKGELSIKLDSTLPVIAERPMYFNYRGSWNGGHCVMGVNGAATNWYFAEGYTGYGFEEYLTIQNPNDGAATLNVNYMMSNGNNYLKTHVVQPRSRYTIHVHRDCPERGDISIKLESTLPVIAERPMYFNYRGKWTDGHCVFGALSNATTWFLAESCNDCYRIAPDPSTYTDQLGWLRDDLAAHQDSSFKGLFMHHDPTVDGMWKPSDYFGIIVLGQYGKGRMAVQRLCSEYKVNMVMSGHDHVDQYHELAWAMGGGKTIFPNATSVAIQKDGVSNRYPGFKIAEFSGWNLVSHSYKYLNGVYYSYPYYEGVNIGGNTDLSKLNKTSVQYIFSNNGDWSGGDTDVWCDITNKLEKAFSQCELEFFMPRPGLGYHYEVYGADSYLVSEVPEHPDRLNFQLRVTIGSLASKTVRITQVED